MAAPKGSRYILGHLGYADLARIDDEQEAVVVLNPLEPDARAEASKNVKAAFIKAGRRCIVSTQSILVEAEPGVWRQSHFLYVKAVSLSHVEVS